MAFCAILPTMSNRASSDADTVAVEAYVFDTLMHDLIGHDRAASAFVVYLHLWCGVREDIRGYTVRRPWRR